MGDWFVSVDGRNTGPHPAEHVRHWLEAGQVPPSALLWPTDGSSGADWLSVEQAWPQLNGAPPPGASGPVSSGPGAVGPVSSGPGASGPGASGPVTRADVPAPPGTGPVGAATGGYPMRGFPAVAAAAPHTPGWNPVQALADFAGVDRLEGFRPGELLSAVFRRYSREETERHFATGLPETTPEVHEIEPGWPKPWMFVRLLGMSSVLFVGFLVLIKLFDGGNLLPGLIVVGSFAVPLSVLVFFFEVNSPRNVSLYLVIHCLLMGGLISLAITLLLEQTVGRVDEYFFHTFVDPVLIGVAEEVAKLVAVFLITLRLPAVRYPWILNGMLFGAAVGAGFACFESAGYAFYSLLLPDPANADAVGPNLAGSVNTIVLRGVLAPFGHVVWTALVAGALWRVKLAGGLDARMLLSQRVLRMLLIVVVLHALWDFDFTARIPYYLGQIGLGVVAWVLAFGMLQNGLKQIKAAKAASPIGFLRVSGATQVLRTVGQVGS
jgi:protease PrsW